MASAEYKAGQHAAARNVAEVTERHRNWLGNLGDKVHRGHNHNRLGKAFQPAADAVALDGAAPAEEAGHQRPCHGGGQIGRGRTENAGHTDKGTAH